MLETKNRLRKNKQFNYIYRSGQAVHTNFLSLAYAKTKFEPIKIGFSVSKKVGKSVVRNKVKRRLSEIVKKQIILLPKFNYVFIAREGIANLSFDELKTEVSTVIGKINERIKKNS